MFGFHLKENTLNEINKLRKYKCNLIQIFPDELEEVNFILTKNKITDLNYIIHSSFIINISQPFRPKSYTTLKCIEEIKESMKYNVLGYVLHVGIVRKKIKMTQQQAFNNMVNILIYISKFFKLHKNNKFTIYLELLAGSENDIIYNLIDQNNYLSLKYFNDLTNKNKYLKNLKYCLDTCHIFASGVHLDKKEGFQKYILDFNKYIGIDKIGLIHLNDSFYEFNTKKDKHEILSKGYIGKNLKYIFEIFYKLKIPIIIEVGNIDENMKLIKSLIK